MALVWHVLGLVNVEQGSVLIRMEFACTDVYWYYSQPEARPANS